MKKTIKLNESDLHRIIKQVINEAFKSNQLRDWFNNHGGVDKTHGGCDLSDINDDDIIYMQEFSNELEASNICWKLNHPKSKWSDGNDPFSQDGLYYLYKAKDGCYAVVGIRRNGSVKLSTDRSEKVRKRSDDRYYGRKQDNLYHYGPHGQNFGLNTNDDYRGKLKDKEDLRKLMSPDEFEKYQRKRASYMKKYRNIKKQREKEHEDIFGYKWSNPGTISFLAHQK